MEFRDLKKQYESLKDEIDAAVMEVMKDCNFISGRQVMQLEAELANYVGMKHCITCANGTDALTMALMAWKIGPGDACFVPDFTFFASGETVAYEGATPVFVDVCEDTFNMDPDCLERTIRKVLAEGRLVPKAIIAVDLFGQPADYPRIREIADKYGLKILEDGAQGFGGAIDGKRCCSFGDISTTSFFPAKPLGCYGDGGAIFTNDDETAAYLDSIRVHGKGSFKYDNVRIGLNSRLDTIQAAILLQKLKAFKEYELEKVNAVAKMYTSLLSPYAAVPSVPEGFYSSWAQYCLKLRDQEERDRLKEYLSNCGIPTMIYYPNPMHRQRAFKGLSTYGETLEVTDRLCKTVLEIPIHPYMTEEDCMLVAENVKEFSINTQKL